MSENVLEEANNLINGDRQRDYGSALECHAAIADLWSAYLDIELDALDVAKMMILLKVARSRDTFKRDSFVDIAGYAGIAERIQSELDSQIKVPKFNGDQFIFNVMSVDEAREHLNVPKSDQAFVDHVTEPPKPRVWGKWADIPVGVSVEDVDGDRWIKTLTSWRIQWAGKGEWFDPDELLVTVPDDVDAPYTEVIG